MAINPNKLKFNPDNEEFRWFMERIATGIRTSNSESIEAIKKDLKDAGLKISISYLPESDRIQLIREGKPPLIFSVSDFVKQVPDGEDAQPGDS